MNIFRFMAYCINTNTTKSLNYRILFQIPKFLQNILLSFYKTNIKKK